MSVIYLGTHSGTKVGTYGGWILWQGNKSANVFSDELRDWALHNPKK